MEARGERERGDDMQNGDRRRALVTGAAAGLAAGIAPALAAAGFERIAITYRHTPPESTLAAIAAAGSTGAAARIDFLDDAESIEAALATFVREQGPFDTLVHSVGPLVVKRFERSTPQDYAEMFDGNVRSAVLAARAVLPGMRTRHFGRLIFFGMNGSATTQPFPGFALYQAAKSAVVAFARGLALEEARNGITVNAVEPGDLREKTIVREEAREHTAGNPRGRPGSFEDVADVVRFLVAPERDFLTGAVIAVTGGLTQADERNASAR